MTVQLIQNNFETEVSIHFSQASLLTLIQLTLIRKCLPNIR